MKKNINRLVALGIALNIMGSGCISAYGIEKNEKVLATVSQSYEAIENKPIITCDTLIERAIENSNSLKLKSIEITMYKQKIDTQEQLNDEISVVSSSSDYSEYFLERTGDYYLDSYEINIQAAKQDKKFMQDKIARDIRDMYEDIVIREIEIKKIKRQIEVQNNTAMYAEINVNTGYGTENTKLASDIAVKKLKNDLSVKENLLKNKKDYLGVLTDSDLSKYRFDYSLLYVPVTINGNSDDYFEEKINQYFNYKDKLLDLSEDYAEDLDDNIEDSPSEPKKPSADSLIVYDGDGNIDVNGTNTAISDAAEKYTKELTKYIQELNSYLKYEDIKYEVASNKVRLEDSRKLMKNSLDEAYSTLKDVENQINLMNDQFKYVNNNLMYGRVQCDIGMMTVNDYNNNVISAEDLEIGLRKLVNGYNKLKDTVEKPWCVIDEK